MDTIGTPCYTIGNISINSSRIGQRDHASQKAKGRQTDDGPKNQTPFPTPLLSGKHSEAVTFYPMYLSVKNDKEA
jgi:hypothetical protein